MSLLPFAIPILPGKREQWERFVVDLSTTRRQDFVESRRRLGVRERTFLQETPMGDLVIITQEGENPERILAWLGSDDPFARWMAQHASPLHGVDLGKPFPEDALPKLVLDTGTTARGSEMMAFVLPIQPGKTDHWQKFVAEMNGPRMADLKASREQMGLHQRVFYQRTPMGEIQIVTLVGADPSAIRHWFQSGDPLSRFVAGQLLEITGVDMTKPLPEGFQARLVIDSEREVVKRAA